jgi:hypothetical protein
LRKSGTFHPKLRPQVTQKLKFLIHFSDTDILSCQIVNTPSKAAKDFYSRIEGLNLFWDFRYLWSFSLWQPKTAVTLFNQQLGSFYPGLALTQKCTLSIAFLVYLLYDKF